MKNILKLPVAHLRPRSTDCADSLDRAALVRDLVVQTKSVLLQAILLLDLSAQHGRQLAKLIGDPTRKISIEADVDLIEAALRVARMKALAI